MKNYILIFLLALALSACKENKIDKVQHTVCNPMDLSYRFCVDEPSRREAADPTMVRFGEGYLLFASKSGGYWYSEDLASWTFIRSVDIPAEEYAPTVVAIGDTLYFLASSHERNTIYKSADPLSGKWQLACDRLDSAVWDPDLFLDDDNRLYLYWGCSNMTPIYGVELDYRNNFAFKGQVEKLIYPDTKRYGWENPGDYNTLVNQAPWIEGAWMNKYQGKYYLQFAIPGTEYKSYADGVCVAEHPLGPYTYQAHNPFAYKPEGFAAGAGHGSTFEDKYGNFWHVGTITISQKHIFERRLAIYPLFFDEDGVMYADTRFGDYPMIVPDHKINSFEEIFPGWMLLSYRKPVEVSSTGDSLSTSYLTDEDIRTYWAAASGDAGEYAILDLEAVQAVYGVQLNFAEHGTAIFDRQPGLKLRFTLDYSVDGQEWVTLLDRSENESDNTHVYFAPEEKVEARYLRVQNIAVPDGAFAMSGFRVFGKASGTVPEPVSVFTVSRDEQDSRSADLAWMASEGADGYLIRFGTDSQKLYHSYMVYGVNKLTLNSLDAEQAYWFSIEAFNGSGSSPATGIVEIH